jgi:hypothetical protein
MLVKGGLDGARRGHSHQRSPAAVTTGRTGAGAGLAGPANGGFDSRRTAWSRAAWAVGLKLAGMGQTSLGSDRLTGQPRANRLRSREAGPAPEVIPEGGLGSRTAVLVGSGRAGV